MKILFKSIIATVVLCFIFSCNKTTFVGADIFPNGIDVFYKDDFEIIAKTIRIDSFVTFDNLSFMGSMVCGKMEDPVFGTTTAEMYIDMHIASLIPPFNYIEDALVKEVTLDSVILVLAYNQAGFYGDSTLSHQITASQLQNEMIFKDSIWSTFSPAVSDFVFGETTLVPNAVDSVAALEPLDTAATFYTEQLRIRVDNDFVQPMISDTSIVSSDDNFTNYAKGLHIKSIPNGSSMWSMDNERASEIPYNTMQVYYSRDTVQSSYSIFIDGERTNYVTHDYTGSVVEEFFDDEEKGDSLLFLQGLAGPNIELDIPALADPEFDDFLVNKAELEFFVLEDETSELFEPIQEILLQRYDSNGDILVTEDVFLAFQSLNEASFDGDLTETQFDGQIIKKYTAIMSVHVTRMFNEDDPDTRIRIAPVNKRLTPSRSIIFGPGHSKYPMKFKLTYSK